jgi:hypothetical protein
MKRTNFKVASTLLTLTIVALILVVVALIAGCQHDPRSIRIDNAGAEGFDSPQELTDSQKQRIVGIILDSPEAREQPPTESIYRTWLMWTAIIWDDSRYSYMSSFDLEGVKADPEYPTVPDSARWYPGATLYYGDPQAPTAEWLIQAHVDLDAGKVVYINSMPYKAAPLSAPTPRSSSFETEETRTYLSIKELSPPMDEEAPDDIVPTPGGGTYRANVHQQGVENPWPPIESTDVVLGSGSDALNVSYRDYIKTEAGETRNNIIRIRKESGLFNKTLALYSVDVPAGLSLTDGGRGVGLPGTLGAVLVIDISPDVAPGEYTFEVGMEIDGKDYGTIPCIIEVIREPYPGNHGITTTKIEPKPGESSMSVSALMIRLTLDDLVEKSDAVVIGKVVDIFPSRKVDGKPMDVTIEVVEPWNIITDVVIEVERCLYGQPIPPYIAIMVRGGRVGDTGMWVEDEPVFNLDEEVALFLDRRQDGVTPPEGFDYAESLLSKLSFQDEPVFGITS